MSDAESTAVELESAAPKQNDSHDRKPPVSAVSYSLWPPTERTRNAVVDRLIETLTTPSPLSRRYGTLSVSEAASEARLIEQDAFAAAGGSAATEISSETGMKILQIYSKEISQRMLEVVKSKSIAASNGAANESAESGGPTEDASVAADEVKEENEDKSEEELKELEAKTEELKIEEELKELEAKTEELKIEESN